jgi:hypothetical protein
VSPDFAHAKPQSHEGEEIISAAFFFVVFVPWCEDILSFRAEAAPDPLKLKMMPDPGLPRIEISPDVRDQTIPRFLRVLPVPLEFSEQHTLFIAYARGQQERQQYAGYHGPIRAQGQGRENVHQ